MLSLTGPLLCSCLHMGAGCAVDVIAHEAAGCLPRLKFSRGGWKLRPLQVPTPASPMKRQMTLRARSIGG